MQFNQTNKPGFFFWLRSRTPQPSDSNN